MHDLLPTCRAGQSWACMERTSWQEAVVELIDGGMACECDDCLYYDKNLEKFSRHYLDDGPSLLFLQTSPCVHVHTKSSISLTHGCMYSTYTPLIALYLLN